MIKNIIILVLILALGAMYWLSFPEEKTMNPPTAAELGKHVIAAAEKIKGVLPVGPGNGVDNPEQTKEIPATTQHSTEGHQVKNRTTSVLKLENQGSVDKMVVASRNAEGTRTGSLKESSVESLKTSEVSSPPTSDGAVKEDLSRSELEEILSLLRQAKSTLRKKLFPFQTANLTNTKSSTSDETSPIKKKSLDGPEKWE